MVYNFRRHGHNEYRRLESTQVQDAGLGTGSWRLGVGQGR